MELTREDLSIIFSSIDKFLLGSRLYKIAKNASKASEKFCLQDTNDLLQELDDVLELDSSQGSVIGVTSTASTPVSGSLPSCSRGSTPVSRSLPSCSRGSTPVSVGRHSISTRASALGCRTPSSEVEQCSKWRRTEEFKLPIFSPDIRKCIEKDAFYTNTQRNRLIKVACLALRGYFCVK